MPSTLSAHPNTLEATAVTGPATDEEFGNITSTARLGSLLRGLRGDKTQQNIADHAKRHHFSVHRPDLSAIERGRRLPTANELRGILHGCGRPDLFDRLDCIRQQLMAEPADPPASNGQHQPVIYLPTAAPDTSVETAFRVGSRELDHGRRRKLIVAIFTAAAVVITTLVVLAAHATNTSTQRSGPETLPSQLETSAAVAALRDVPLCAEQLAPNVGVSSVFAQEIGPADAVQPNRLVELHAYHDPRYGWIAWAHLAKSASSRDRLWLDWSYLPEPTDRSQWRQCGPHPIGFGPDSPAVRTVDSDQRQRWFRACGQAPPEDRPPGSKRNSFCTSWVPIRP